MHLIPTGYVLREAVRLEGCSFYLLTYGGVSRKDVCVFGHRLVGRVVRADFQHAAPFGKTCAVLSVLGAPLGQTVQTCVAPVFGSAKQ